MTTERSPSTHTGPATAHDNRAASPASRGVLQGAFGLLSLLQHAGSARVSELQRDSNLPRTTVHRLLAQLAEVGAVERSGRRWRLGPTLVELGADVPAEPRLRSVAQRPLLDLAQATGALVALSVEMAGHAMVIDVVRARHRLPVEPAPGIEMDDIRMAGLRAHQQARRGDMQPVIDAGRVDPRVSCAAAPLRLSRRDVAAVWLMVPGGAGVPAPLIAAIRHTAGRIATQLSKPSLA
jgi:IclR family transcriptional regulator, acetate operon repressor